MVEDYSQYSISELLSLSAQSHDAMRELIQRHARLVRACARPLFLTGGDNEDLVQEGMIGLLDAIRSYEAERETPFEAYAALCIRRRMISAVRAACTLHFAGLLPPAVFNTHSPEGRQQISAKIFSRFSLFCLIRDVAAPGKMGTGPGCAEGRAWLAGFAVCEDIGDGANPEGRNEARYLTIDYQ